MSNCKNIPITCPNCDKPSDFVVWSSINTTLNPELKDILLDGSLLKFTCPYCTFSQLVFYTLLYHDMTAYFMIWWIPEDEHGQQDYDQVTLERYAQAMPGYCMRIVPTYQRLLEKIFILDSKLDDRALELMKRFIWAAHLAGQGIQEDWLYISNITSDGEYPVIQLSAIIPGEGERGFSVSGQGGYPRALEMLHDVFKVPRQEPTHWRIIDHHYWDLAKAGIG